MTIEVRLYQAKSTTNDRCTAITCPKVDIYTEAAEGFDNEKLVKLSEQARDLFDKGLNDALTKGGEQ